MDPAQLENDLPPPQRSRIVDFRFTDPVRFLFEHMQGDSNKPNSEKINNEDWSKERNSAAKVSQTIERNALSPTLKGSYQDLYSGENVFTRVTSSLDKPEALDKNISHATDLGSNIVSPENNSGPLPPVQNSNLERNNNPVDIDTNRLSSSNRKQPQSNEIPAKANTFSSLVFRASKLEAVANNLARNRLSGNATSARRQEQPARTPILKPPPLTKRFASRAFRRPGKPPPPLTTSATSRTLQQSSPLQATTTGTKPSTVSNPPAVKQVTPPPAPDSEPDSQGTVNTEDSEQEDPLQTLLQLCKKSDWQGVEGLLKQFSKTGLPTTLVDPAKMKLIQGFDELPNNVKVR
ncbi:transposable element Tc3 transposase [Caerostris darwini]|uniref:Transposable element Tc3 transposase n=1 Tax=Caerostris darwini TaxID=1538125 RepID=A0AAV4WTJ6_9ARAC|nr:transposable element Tc3 transposase [Caerostris darwini]